MLTFGQIRSLFLLVSLKNKNSKQATVYSMYLKVKERKKIEILGFWGDYNENRWKSTRCGIMFEKL